MPRNGTGVYSVPNPILVGAIRSSSDAGAQITNSLPRDAQAGMLAPLKAFAGTRALPGITFGADRNLGIYRAGPNDMRWAVLGSDAFWFDDEGHGHLTGAVDVAGDIDISHGIDGGNCGTIENLDGTGLACRIGTADWDLDPGEFLLPFIVDTAGNPMRTGVKGDLMLPCACTLTGVRVLANVVGSLVVDIWRDTYANYPPTSGDTICGSTRPTLAEEIRHENLSLTGWSTSLSVGDILRFNVTSVTSITRFKIDLRARRYA